MEPALVGALAAVMGSLVGGAATMATAWITWVNIEQFSVWHNIPLATKQNGIGGFDTELKINSPTHVKHLENLVELQKTKTFDYAGRTNTGEGRFTLEPLDGGGRTRFTWEEDLSFPWYLGGPLTERIGGQQVMRRIWSGNLERLRALVERTD